MEERVLAGKKAGSVLGGEAKLAHVVGEVAEARERRAKTRGPMVRDVLGTQPYFDAAIGGGTRLAGEHAILGPVAIGEPWRVGTQRRDLAFQQLHLAGPARAGVALVGHAEARAQPRAQQRVVVRAAVVLTFGELDGVHQSPRCAPANDGR